MGAVVRGFAALTPEQRRAVASSGGKAAHANGTAYRWTSEAAQVAGRKGGQRSALARRCAACGRVLGQGGTTRACRSLTYGGVCAP
jgi:hypothetical protein